MRRLFPKVLCLCLLLAFLGAAAGDKSNYIVAVSRGGVIEFINPKNLETVGRIHFTLSEKSGGLNGVAANPDGSMLYVEGPIRGSDGLQGCCWLYSIDLATLETKKVAGIWGTRRNILVSAGVVYRDLGASANVADLAMKGDQWHFSPDGRWLLGVRRDPGIDVYDLSRKAPVRQLTAAPLGDGWWDMGTWSGDRFYLYATEANGSGKLWTVSPETTELGDAVDVPPLSPNCSGPALTGIVSTGSRLLAYLVFGAKLDPRDKCGDSMPGGAWVVDPATGHLGDQLRPDLHFWTLISSRDGLQLYGLSYGSTLRAPVELVRIDAQNLHTTHERPLENDYWWIVAASLRSAPSGDVWAMLPKQ